MKRAPQMRKNQLIIANLAIRIAGVMALLAVAFE
jgi:Flp pilus assembly protein CpaB